MYQGGTQLMQKKYVVGKFGAPFAQNPLWEG